MNYFSLLALFAGMSIAIQAGMNAQLGVLLKNPLLAAMVAFAVACCSTLLVVILTVRQYPPLNNLYFIPAYLWFSGAISAFGVGLFYFLIPRMGVGPMMSFALTGQLIIAMVISHYGCFDLPVKPINLMKCIGVLALIIGILLINRE
jgi:bacterial/archaeal transporter family-2 protein